MKRNSNYLIAIVFICSFFACEDILEEDLTDDQVTVISPLEGDIIEGNTVQFLWNTLEGAEEYNLQLYSNNFLVMDSIISSPPFSTVLSSDIYEWRIKAMNPAYESQYNFPVAFEVVSSQDLTNQTVVLNSPSDNLYTNNPTIIFTWDPVENATTYTYQLDKITNSGSATVFIEENLTATSVSLDATVISEDAEYQWMVKAVNESSETTFSVRTLFVDTVVPSSPSLLSPQFEEEFVLADVITFSWSFGVDPGAINSTITSVYDIASDAAFTNIVESGSSVSTTFNYSFNAIGTYYWRVRGEDEAGNVGAYNQNGKLIVNE